MRFPRVREAYGPRQKRRYVDDATPFPASASLNRIAIPMPRGGVRYVMPCPSCGKHRTAVYRFSWGLACRECLGMRYRSQYEGRRVESTSDRIQWMYARLNRRHARLDPLFQRARRSGNWDRYNRVWASYSRASDRWCDAADRLDMKVARYIADSELGTARFLMKVLEFFAREEAHLEYRRRYMWRYRRGWHAGDHPAIVPPARPCPARDALEAAQEARAALAESLAERAMLAATG